MKLLIKRILPLALAGLLAACGSDNDDPVVMNDDMMPAEPVVTEMQYQVTVMNLTNAQPLSPVAVVLHQTGEVWQIGQMASEALEIMAESGDNSGILGADFVIAGETNGGIVMPGAQAQIMLSTTDENAQKLSLTTMLVNTNDAFSGLNAIDVSQLAVGEMLMLRAHIYDAGTEANSEMPGTIPGPADGGEGFNAARDDVDFVAMHPGVVSHDDGLSASVLTGEHKFDNPGIAVRIMRMQ